MSLDLLFPVTHRTFRSACQGGPPNIMVRPAGPPPETPSFPFGTEPRVPPSSAGRKAASQLPPPPPPFTLYTRRLGALSSRTCSLDDYYPFPGSPKTSGPRGYGPLTVMLTLSKRRRPSASNRGALVSFGLSPRVALRPAGRRQAA